MPPTVLRDGPFGEGMVQAYVEADPDVDVVAMVVGDDPRLRRMAVARRRDEQHRPQGRPHPAGRRRAALSTASTTASASRPCPKLRTVLWGWRGQPFEPDEVDGPGAASARACDGDLGAALRELLVGGRGPGHAPARGRPARGRTVPAPLPDLAGHPLAAVLTVARAAGAR